MSEQPAVQPPVDAGQTRHDPARLAPKPARQAEAAPTYPCPRAARQALLRGLTGLLAATGTDRLRMAAAPYREGAVAGCGACPACFRGGA